MRMPSSVILILIVSRGLLVQSKYNILPKAIKHAIASSFSGSTNLLHIVIETDFNENKKTFIDFIDSILVENWSFSLQIDVNRKNGRAVSDHNLWFVDTYEAFRRLLPWIRDDHNDSQLFYFIVLGVSKTKEHFLDLTQKIFSDFLALMVANVNIIIDTTSEGVLFYTFHPYQEADCQSSKPILVHRFQNNNSITSSEQFFPPKADNFHGCPLRAKTRNELILNINNNLAPKRLANYEMSNFELVILKEIAYRMNFSVESVDVSTFPDVFLNTTFVVPFATHELLSNNATDLVLGYYKANVFENHFLSKSVTYFFSWLVICLQPQPNTFRMQGWMFVPFKRSTWVFIVISLGAVIVFLIWVRRCRKLCSILRIENHYAGGLEIMAVVIGASVGHLSRKNSLRFAFIVLSLGTLILRAAYLGMLFDAYRRHSMKHTPHSIAELFKENYTIYAHRSYQPVISDLNGMEYPYFEDLEVFLRGVDLFDADKKKAVVTSYIVMHTFYTEQELKKLIMEPVFVEQICMFFKQHSVIKPRINEIIMRMEEAGILNYLRQGFQNINDLLSLKKRPIEPQPLVLERFAVAFYLWGTLCAVSCLVFVAELNFFRIVAL